MQEDSPQPEGLAVERGADLFRQLGDPTRVAIIAALATHQRRADEPLSFAALRRRTGVADSGRFNYHLKELQPRFVASTEDGYRLRHAGHEAYNLIAAGLGTEEQVERESTTDYTCFVCEGSLTVAYRFDQLRLTCPEHGLVGALPLPPAEAIARDIDELVRLAMVDARAKLAYARDRICPECFGAQSVSYRKPAVATPHDVVIVDMPCDRCTNTYQFSLGHIVAPDPTVVAFHHDHGIILAADNIFVGPKQLAIDAAGVNPDGSEAWMSFALDGEQLRVEVDDRLEITPV